MFVARFQSLCAKCTPAKAMSQNLDSEVVFKARAQAVGLEAGQVTRLVNAGFGALAKFAFTRALEAALGAPPSAAHLSSLRRLFYEAFTIAASDLKSKL